MHKLRCRKCREMFDCPGLPVPLCPECEALKSGKFQLIRELIKDHPGITVPDLHERTGVPVAVILKYINSGDLDVTLPPN